MASPAPIRVVADFLGYLMLFRAAPESQRPAPGALRNTLLGLIEAISKNTSVDRLPDGDLQEVRFALVAFADEVIMGSGWSGAEEWKRETLAKLLFDTVRAGNEFFERLRRLRPDQVAAREVYFLCLALGFQGEFVDDPSGRNELIRQNYELVRGAGRALDSVGLKRLAPPAYDYDITLPTTRGRRVWPRLLQLALLTGLVWGALWLALRFAASGVPTPGAGA